jgi:hypothetical protein
LPCKKALFLVFCGGELDDQIHIVGLDLCLVSGLVSDRLAAFFTAVNYDISLLRVGHSTNRAEYSATFVGSVAGIYVHVERAEAEWTVISRGVDKGQNLFTAIFADKAGIIFSKTLVFHISP